MVYALDATHTSDLVTGSTFDTIVGSILKINTYDATHVINLSMKLNTYSNIIVTQYPAGGIVSFFRNLQVPVSSTVSSQFTFDSNVITNVEA